MHKQHFRGCWLRPEILELWKNKEINSKEVLLLLLIDSLVDPKGKDCWASNAYLEGWTGDSPKTISGIITRLKKLGLLIQTGFNGRRRYLTTAWSHLDNQTTSKTGSQTTGKTGSPLNKDLINLNISLPHQRDDDGRAVYEESNQKNSKGKLHPRWGKFAIQLYQAIESVRVVPKNTQLWRWAQAISKVQSIDGQTPLHIRNVLKWYCKQIRKGDLIKDNSSFIPIAYSGVVFREKFTMIEGAMNRAKAQAPKQKEFQYKIIRDEDTAGETQED